MNASEYSKHKPTSNLTQLREKGSILKEEEEVEQIY